MQPRTSTPKFVTRVKLVTFTMLGVLIYSPECPRCSGSAYGIMRFRDFLVGEASFALSGNQTS